MTKKLRSLAQITLAVSVMFIMGCGVNLAIGDAARSTLSSFLSSLVTSAIDQTVNPQN
ncbi:MAG: hypothetical protein HY287_10315 [Planctomycetes bacterium]|nr:hypothetical protein [Planctomycetota bacterium]MBI3834710.1 hypothetical protein [Planctomycetota bacterium]